jgi:hypothetical protein
MESTVEEKRDVLDEQVGKGSAFTVEMPAKEKPGVT